ncbi:lysozyme, partial [Eremomyces bilateralis CBS 781.70]
ACTVLSIPGICQPIATCKGTSNPGFCPGPAGTVRCTTDPCTDIGGTCESDTTCRGISTPGICSGAADEQCCTTFPGTRGKRCQYEGINTAGLTLIKRWEGLVCAPAPDPIGLPTVGYGHLCEIENCGEVEYKFPLTADSADKLLRDDLVTYKQCLSTMLNDTVILNKNQYGALVSFTLNMGCGQMQNSTLVDRLNAGEEPVKVASEELPRWVYAGGDVLPGLVKRRADEVRLFKIPEKQIGHPPQCIGFRFDDTDDGSYTGVISK